LQATKKNLLVIANCEPLEHLGSGYVIKNFLSILENYFLLELRTPKDYKPIKFLKNKAKFYQTSWGMLQQVRKATQSKKADAVLFFGGEAWLAAQYLGLFKPSIKRLHHSNGIEPVYATATASFSNSNKTGYKIIGQVSRKSFSNMHGIVLHNIHDSEWLQQYMQIKQERILYVPIPLPQIMLSLQNPSIQQRPKTIGFCGSWMLRKGSDIVVAVMNKLLVQFPDWELYIIGQPSNFNVKEHFAADVCQQINIVPMITSKEGMIDMLQQIRIMFLPSRLESFGLVFTEAMACGCVLVAGKTGFNYTIKDEAIIIEGADVAAYENAISQLMSNEKYCSDIASKGYQLVQELNWSSIEAKYLSFINSRINSN
jgi:glycosyltransferase involved in cell wall biosynthesis